MDWKLKRIYIKKFKGHAACWKPLVPSVLVFFAEGEATWHQEPSWRRLELAGTRFLVPLTARREQKVHAEGHHVPHDQQGAQELPEEISALQRRENHQVNSGRRHAISSFAGGGLSADVGMIFAQITSFRIYQKYIDAEPQHVARQMKAFDRQNHIA